MQLTTTNPENLIYEHEILKVTVLGGIKLEGLDRLRVTIKLELKGTSVPPVRHSFDLYNDAQLEKFIRKTAERLEVGTSVIAATLSELTEQLESYRLERIKDKEPTLPQKPTLNTDEVRAAQAFLKQDNLLKVTNELIGQAGILGEETNRLLMYLIFSSRKRQQPLHIVSLGESGTGKTHLQEKIGELIPEEDKIEITTLSENAFYYFGQRELKNKLILIEDLDGAENVMYPLRELQTKNSIRKTIAHKNSKGETKTMHLVVEGPVSVAGCTTRERIYEDNANRSFLIYLDNSPEQDQRIMNYQRKLSSGNINTEAQKEIQNLLKNTQRLLEPIKIINPYAEQLNLPIEVLKPRRTNTHYLQFIEVITYYHQWQREKKVDKSTGEMYIETTLEDIAEANKLLKETLLRKSDELSGACRNYFENLKEYLQEKEIVSFTNGEISKGLRMPIATIKRHHYQLVESQYLRIKKKKDSRANYYEVMSYEEYKTLQEQVNTVLDEALKGVILSLSKKKK